MSAKLAPNALLATAHRQSRAAQSVPPVLNSTRLLDPCKSYRPKLRSRPCLVVAARRRRPSGGRPPDPPQGREEPFNVELLILFGVPVVVLVITYAFNDPKSLAIALPLILLIPGPREGLLAACGDMLKGMRRAKSFVSVNKAGRADATQQEQQRNRQQRWRQQAARSQRRPPPPPPPPPPPDYELRKGADYVVVDQPQQGAPGSSFTQPWPPAAQPPLRPTFTEDLPAVKPSPSSAQRQQQQSSAPSPPTVGRASHVGDSDSNGQQRLTLERSVSAGSAHNQQQPPARRRIARSSRLVPPASMARVENEDGGKQQEIDVASLLLRPILAVFPFLRSWGGFLDGK